MTVVVWALGLIAFLVSIEWVVDNAHYIAAGGLLACILVVAVAVANAVRYGGAQPGGKSAREQARNGVRAARSAVVRHPTQIFRSPKEYRYVWLAWLILVATLVGVALMTVMVISLFWFEIIMACLFIAFWVVHTIEQLP